MGCSEVVCGEATARNVPRRTAGGWLIQLFDLMTQYKLHIALLQVSMVLHLGHARCVWVHHMLAYMPLIGHGVRHRAHHSSLILLHASTLALIICGLDLASCAQRRRAVEHTLILCKTHLGHRWGCLAALYSDVLHLNSQLLTLLYFVAISAPQTNAATTNQG